MTKLTGFRWLDLRSPVRALSVQRTVFLSPFFLSAMNAGHRMDALHFPSLSPARLKSIEQRGSPHNFFFVNCALPNLRFKSLSVSFTHARFLRFLSGLLCLLLVVSIVIISDNIFFFFWIFNENTTNRDLRVIVFDEWLEMLKKERIYFIMFLCFLLKDSVSLVPLLWWFGRESIFQKE